MEYCAELDKMIENLKKFLNLLKNINIQNNNIFNILAFILQKYLDRLKIIYTIYCTTDLDLNFIPISFKEKITYKNEKINLRKLEITKKEDLQKFPKKEEYNINLIIKKIINEFLDDLDIDILQYILQNFKLDHKTKQKIKARIEKIKKQLKEEQRINHGSNEQNLS